MKDSASIEEFLDVIRILPEDAPVHNPKIWYHTQKEHWIGWLSEYHSSGAYGRKTGVKRDAKFAYNHIVCPDMLLWLIDAAGVDPELVAASREASASGATLMQKSAAIRRLVPWETVAAALGQSQPPNTRATPSGGIRQSFWSVLASARLRR